MTLQELIDETLYRIADNLGVPYELLTEDYRTDATMLVVSRKRDEDIIINDNIVVKVIEIRGDKVRLGIDAPKEVPVHRREVYEAIQRHA